MSKGRIFLLTAVPAVAVGYLLHRYTDRKLGAVDRALSPQSLEKNYPALRHDTLSGATRVATSEIIGAARDAARALASAPAQAMDVIKDKAHAVDKAIAPTQLQKASDAAQQALPSAYSTMDNLASAQKERYQLRHPHPDEASAKAFPSWEPPPLPGDPQAPAIAHHHYPVPSGLSVEGALDVMTRNISRHAEMVHAELEHVSAASTSTSAARLNPRAPATLSPRISTLHHPAHPSPRSFSTSSPPSKSTRATRPRPWRKRSASFSARCPRVCGPPRSPPSSEKVLEKVSFSFSPPPPPLFAQITCAQLCKVRPSETPGRRACL
jgi:hypothetical protein